jgi:predicted transcriptional regulator
MRTLESVQPSDEELEVTREVLREGAPMRHDEIVQQTDLDDSVVKRVLNELWERGEVYHTVDRQVDLTENFQV